MTRLEACVRSARRLLWINRFLHTLCLVAAVAGGGFAAFLIIERLWDLTLPVGPLAIVAVGASLLISFAWSMVRLEKLVDAAAALDQAAGLRERLSSGWFCRQSTDPFAQAVVVDAERIGSSITVGRHLRLRVPRVFSWTATSWLAAAMTFLIPRGAARSAAENQPPDQVAQREVAHVAVKKQMEALQQFADATPAAAEFAEQLKNLDPGPGGELHKPGDVRHDAVKKLDRLEDIVRQRRDGESYEAVPQLKKSLRILQVPESDDAPTRKLAEALRDGDFKAAKEEAESLREQLATLKSDQDKEAVEKLSQQLDDLAKQLEKLAEDRNLAQKLEQTGIDKKDVERMLERLGKEDLEQIRKTLEEKGFTQQQIEQLAKQMQQRQQAGTAAKKLAQSLKQASQASTAEEKAEAAAG